MERAPNLGRRRRTSSSLCPVWDKTYSKERGEGFCLNLGYPNTLDQNKFMYNNDIFPMYWRWTFSFLRLLYQSFLEPFVLTFRLVTISTHSLCTLRQDDKRWNHLQIRIFFKISYVVVRIHYRHSVFCPYRVFFYFSLY